MCGGRGGGEGGWARRGGGGSWYIAGTWQILGMKKENSAEYCKYDKTLKNAQDDHRPKAMISVYEKGADNSDENNYEDGDL